jgi:methyl-accepting chemotaxis protein
MKMNFSIKNKLIVGFSVILFGILWTGVESLTTMYSLSDLTAKMYKHPLTVTKASLQANNAILTIHRSMREIALAQDNEGINRAVENVDLYNKKALAELEIVKEFILGKEGEDLIVKTINTFNAWGKVRQETIKLMIAEDENDRRKAAIISKEQLAPLVEKLSDEMDALTEYASVKAEGFNQNAKATYDYVLIWMVSTILILFVLCIVIALVLIKHITQPLGYLQKTIKHIESHSDLTHKTLVYRKDEFGSISTLFNSMIESFNQAIGKVASSSINVSQAAENTATINVATRDSIASQNDQLHQLATSIEEMSASIAEVAENTTLAASSADKAAKETTQGAKLVLQTSQKVNDVSKEFSGVKDSVKLLEEKGQEVTALLDVIKSIADQTNLLALNAAIEAARAGEQGRGFAVVADEVRTLALRTQNSTSEIEKTLSLFATEIERAVSATDIGQAKVAECVEQAELATNSLSNITIAVETIQQMSEQIATAAEQQSKVTEEVSSYIATISEASTETLNNVNESNTAITQQVAMAEELKKLAGKFIHS